MIYLCIQDVLVTHSNVFVRVLLCVFPVATCAWHSNDTAVILIDRLNRWEAALNEAEVYALLVSFMDLHP